ncbi:hypothetical protein NDU88_002844 [Pleurodeles waltl]|uniref:Uncharacterized protein n=1 Tax=Pleurodeles waltl TaxID=8319 RepID=A0AAV7MTY6_PLEWA|nr:hypothetical protein NDU88_002844 [Pleurodeles waltl]
MCLDASAFPDPGSSLDVFNRPVDTDASNLTELRHGGMEDAAQKTWPSYGGWSCVQTPDERTAKGKVYWCPCEVLQHQKDAEYATKSRPFSPGISKSNYVVKGRKLQPDSEEDEKAVLLTTLGEICQEKSTKE